MQPSCAFSFGGTNELNPLKKGHTTTIDRTTIGRLRLPHFGMLFDNAPFNYS
jgi:hypothetical protein